MVVIPQLALSGISRDDARQKTLQIGLQDLLGRLEQLVSQPEYPFEKESRQATQATTGIHLQEYSSESR